MFFLIGVSIVLLPIIFACIKYGGNDPADAVDQMMFNASLQDFLNIRLTIKFGLFVIMFAWFQLIVFHKF